jgi:hypothetical protein
MDRAWHYTKTVFCSIFSLIKGQSGPKVWIEDILGNVCFDDALPSFYKLLKANRNKQVFILFHFFSTDNLYSCNVTPDEIPGPTFFKIVNCVCF